MTDIADELSKLVVLRDSGALTAAEFDEQKARLLRPQPLSTPAPGSRLDGAATSRGQGRRWAAILAAMVAVVAIAWALGLVPRPSFRETRPEDFGLNGKGQEIDTPAGKSTPAAGSTLVAPAQPAATAASNPLLGAWVNEGGQSDCPTQATFTADTIEIHDSVRTETVQASYNVLSPTAVMIGDKQKPGEMKTILVSGDSFTLDKCIMHRAR